MKICHAALVAIAFFVLPATARAEICGDVNQSSSLTTSDALLVLKSSVGQPVILECPSIAELAECQGDLTTAGNALSFCTEDKQQCFSDLDDSGHYLLAAGQCTTPAWRRLAPQHRGDDDRCLSRQLHGWGRDGGLQIAVSRDFEFCMRYTATASPRGIGNRHRFLAARPPRLRHRLHRER